MVGKWKPLLLYLARIRREGEDKLWWVPHLVLNPSTVSWVVMMVSVEGSLFWLVGDHRKDPFFFVLIKTIEKILTMDNLQKRRIIVVNWC
jgi:hypothetical protein